MGSISSDDGAFGEFDSGGGYDVDPVEMFASGEIDKDQLDSYQNVLNSTKGSSDYPVMDDDDRDFSNPTKGGATPLGEPGPEVDYSEALDRLSKIGKGSGPQSLGDSGGLRTSFGERNTKGSGFRKLMNESPYQAPKYYSPQGSILYQGMARDLVKGLLSSRIRNPPITGLV
tara:strand:+ start:1313 stop:1828 length:516 start_codon:yes stop_codon:yes gene_type:complete